MTPLVRYIAICAGALLLACGTAENTTSADESWECTADRDGWEQCDGTSVIWCHGVAHGNRSGAHFHEGASCGGEGLSCVELDERTAACSDPASSCEAGYTECDGRDARNCVNGAVASMQCSLAETCQVLDEGARCLRPEQE